MQLRSRLGPKGTFKKGHDVSSPFLRWCRAQHQRLADEVYVSGLAPDTHQRLLDAEIEAAKNASRDESGSSTRSLFSNCSNENCLEPRLCKILSKGNSCKFLTRAPKVSKEKLKSPYKLRPRRRLSYGESSSSNRSFSSMGVTPLKSDSSYQTSSPAGGSASKKKIPPKLTLSTIKKQRKSVTNISLRVFTGAESELLNSSRCLDDDHGSSPRLKRVNSSSPRDPRKNKWLLNNGLNLSQDLSSICSNTRDASLMRPGNFTNLVSATSSKCRK